MIGDPDAGTERGAFVIRAALAQRAEYIWCAALTCLQHHLSP